MKLFFFLLAENQAIIISNFLRKLMSEINQTSGDKIDSNFVRVSIKKILGEISLKEKNYENDLDSQLICINKKIENLESKKNLIAEELDKKGKKRVNYFLTFLIGQIALIQYGTYVAFSWDIMEPITCLLGVLDMIIAYVFWLRSDRDYSFEGMKEHYVIKRLRSKLSSKLSEGLSQKRDYENEIEVLEKIRKIILMEKEIFRADWVAMKDFFQ